MLQSFDYLSLLGALLGAATVAIFCRYTLYPALFTPLSKIPAAHPLAPWTPLWVLRRRLTARECRTFLKAHRSLGPIVRVGPNEVSINSLEGLKAIYVGNFDRHPYYWNIGNFDGVPNALASLDRESHASSRKLFTALYSKSYIQNSDDVKVIYHEMLAHRLVPRIQKAAQSGEPVEMLNLGDGIGNDFACAFLFGLGNGSDFIRDPDACAEHFQWGEQVRTFTSILGELSPQISFLHGIGIDVLPPHIFGIYDGMAKSVIAMCEKAKSSTGSLVTTVYQEASKRFDKSGISWPKDAKLAAESSDQILAAVETFSTTLTYVIWELSRNKHIQSQLRDEIRTLGESAGFRELDLLPLLDAVVQETLRAYPAVMTSQPRIVPKDGVTLCGYYIPGGVRISCSAGVLHQNEEVYPDAAEWRPSRWLDCSEQQLKEMHRWFWAFGSGVRMCLGIHFAIQQLKAVTAAIYKDHGTIIADAGDMTQIDGFIARPVGNRLVVRFEQVE